MQRPSSRTSALAYIESEVEPVEGLPSPLPTMSDLVSDAAAKTGCLLQLHRFLFVRSKDRHDQQPELKPQRSAHTLGLLMTTWFRRIHLVS